jgi:hypothetical protein
MPEDRAEITHEQTVVPSSMRNSIEPPFLPTDQGIDRPGHPFKALNLLGTAFIAQTPHRRGSPGFSGSADRLNASKSSLTTWRRGGKFCTFDKYPSSSRRAFRLEAFSACEDLVIGIMSLAQGTERTESPPTRPRKQAPGLETQDEMMGFRCDTSPSRSRSNVDGQRTSVR